MEAAVEAARRRALARGLAAEFLVLSIAAAETAADLAGEGRRAWPARIEPVANP